MPKVAKKDPLNDNLGSTTRIRWRFTCWEPTDVMKERMLDFTLDDEVIRYVIFSKELAPNPAPGKDGIHFQGYVELKIRKGFKYLKGRWKTEATHFMIANAPRKGNIEYCSKDVTHLDGPWSNGELLVSAPNEQGKRTDILTVRDAIKAGKDLDYVRDKFSDQYLKYSNAIEKWIEDEKPVYRGKVEKIVFFGPGRSGKTCAARKTWPELYQCEKNASKNAVFDNYNGEETVLINDFKGWKSGWKFDDFLNFAEDDNFGVSLPARYRNKKNCIKRIVFTSTIHPSEWFSNDKDGTSANEDVKAQVLGRVDQLVKFTKVYKDHEKSMKETTWEDFSEKETLRCAEVACNNIIDATSMDSGPVICELNEPQDLGSHENSDTDEE